MIHALTSLVHTRSIAAVGGAYAAGQLTFGDIGGLITAVATAITLVMAVLATAAKRVEKAEQRGHASRNDEVRNLEERVRALEVQVQREREDKEAQVRTERDDKEFYRREYAALLQQRAGASVVPLPPSERAGEETG